MSAGWTACSEATHRANGRPTAAVGRPNFLRDIAFERTRWTRDPQPQQIISYTGAARLSLQSFERCPASHTQGIRHAQTDPGGHRRLPLEEILGTSQRHGPGPDCTDVADRPASGHLIGS